MKANAAPAPLLQKAIDWAVFGVGALALTTAIAATALGPAGDQAQSDETDVVIAAAG